jgi:beta-lactamase class A
MKIMCGNQLLKLVFSACLVLLGFTVPTSCGQSVNTEDPLHENADFPDEHPIQITSLPIHIPDQDFKDLFLLENPQLNQKLEKKLRERPVWNQLIDQKKMCVGLVDLSDVYNPKYAEVNGDHMMYAASLPKIAILLAVQDAIELGYVDETEQLREDMKAMIRSSSNTAATKLIDLVGFEHIEQCLTSDSYCFYDEVNGGGLWVGKRYARTGADTNREPLKNLSHAATAYQVCNFYYHLAYGQLINHERSMDILDIMVDPALSHKFVNTLKKVAPGAKMYRKSGTWRNWHSDSILIWGKKRKYILVALVDYAGGEQVVRDLVRSVESVIID